MLEALSVGDAIATTLVVTLAAHCLENWLSPGTWNEKQPIRAENHITTPTVQPSATPSSGASSPHAQKPCSNITEKTDKKKKPPLRTSQKESIRFNYRAILP
ncbi:hypothetical protein STEG23_010703 [Scotinomys teguina]